jgi:nitrogen fixation NifU-like protein
VSLYGPVIAEHARSPRNFGALEAPDLCAEAVNPLCGDKLRLEIKLADDRISEVRFRGEGCQVALASASVLSEMIGGKPLDEARALSEAALLQALRTELRPSRAQCALLCLQALRKLAGSACRSSGG